MPDRLVRFWAWMDSVVVLMIGLPPLASGFLALIYRVNGWLGSSATMPAFAPIQWFFVCLSGALVALWAAARLLWPSPPLALADAIGRIWVGGLIVWFVRQGAPSVLLLFVVTELGGAAVQLAALRPRWQRNLASA